MEVGRERIRLIWGERRWQKKIEGIERVVGIGMVGAGKTAVVGRVVEPGKVSFAPGYYLALGSRYNLTPGGEA